MHWLIRLYPRVWRERYEEEMLAILEDHKISTATVFDLLIGAFDANLNYNGVGRGRRNMVNRVQSGVLVIFWAFLFFVLGCGMLQRITDPMPVFQQKALSFPAYGLMFDAIVALGSVALVAFLGGGVLLIFKSVRQAVTRNRRDILKRFEVAVFCLILFIVTAILSMWAPGNSTWNQILELFAILFIGVGVFSVSQMISRTEFKWSELKFVFIPEIVIAFSMIVSSVLATVFIIVLSLHVPQLLVSHGMHHSMHAPQFDVSHEINRRLMFSLTGITFMALGTIFAIIGLQRGGSAWKRFSRITD